MRHHHDSLPTVWITGARQGLGAALARYWAGRGARLVLSSRRWDQDEACLRIDELRRLGAADVTIDTVDVSRHEQVARWVESAVAANLYPTVVLHNAAILGPRAPLADIPVDAWRQVFDVNVHGAFYLLRELAPRLDVRQPTVWGWLISSVARRGRAAWGPYAATKAALLNMHQSFAAEIASSAWCSVALNPGGTRTAMRAAAVPDEDPRQVPSAEAVAAAIGAIIDAAGGTSVANGSDIDVRDWMRS